MYLYSHNYISPTTSDGICVCVFVHGITVPIKDRPTALEERKNIPYYTDGLTRPELAIESTRIKALEEKTPRDVPV